MKRNTQKVGRLRIIKRTMEKCKVIGCRNSVMDGYFGSKSHRYGYCQIHKIEGTAEEIIEGGSNDGR